MRYELPSLAFRYTAADGGKTTVAPVIRAGGKSVVKAREHAMLKLERPAHVTILSLVRDAAARLPHGVGTRADVCALLRDSQYFVQETPEAQVGGRRDGGGNNVDISHGSAVVEWRVPGAAHSSQARLIVSLEMTALSF